MPVTPVPELDIAIESGKEWFAVDNGTPFPTENDVFTATIDGTDYKFTFNSDFDDPNFGQWENDTFYCSLTINLDDEFHAQFTNKSGNTLVVGQDYTVSISYDKITVSKDFAIAVAKARQIWPWL